MCNLTQPNMRRIKEERERARVMVRENKKERQNKRERELVHIPVQRRRISRQRKKGERDHKHS